MQSNKSLGVSIAMSCLLFTDVNYSWVSVPFSEDDFKSVAGRHPRDASASTAHTSDAQAAISKGTIVNAAVYSYPQEGCVCVFQRSSALEQHLSLETCKLSPEKHSMMDLAKQRYAAHLQEGVGPLPSLLLPPCVSGVTSGNDRTSNEGWALKEAKKVDRVNDNQKTYLEAKFNIGQATGRKLDPDVVSKEMRRARGVDGERLFVVAEFLSPVRETTSATSTGYGARCACSRGRSELLCSKRLGTFVLADQPSYCCRSIQHLCSS